MTSYKNCAREDINQGNEIVPFILNLYLFSFLWAVTLWRMGEIRHP